MDSLKTWLVEVGYRKIAPSLVKGAIAAGLSILATHQGVLNSIGITWDGSGHVIQIDTDILSSWLLVAGSGLVMALFTTIQHHTTAAIAGQPQSGDLRMPPIRPISANERSTDPPKAA